MEKKDILELIKVLREIKDELKASNELKRKSHVIEKKNFKTNRTVIESSNNNNGQKV